MAKFIDRLTQNTPSSYRILNKATKKSIFIAKAKQHNNLFRFLS